MDAICDFTHMQWHLIIYACRFKITSPGCNFCTDVLKSHLPSHKTTDFIRFNAVVLHDLVFNLQKLFSQ
ncbi:MAG: hypothetical protein ACTSXV_00520 [Alphaproteobacteria bacterium]